MRPALPSRALHRALSAGDLALWDVPGEARVLGLDVVTLDNAYLTTAPRRPRRLLDRFRGPPPTSATDQDITPALRRIREALDYYDVALAAWCCVPVFDVAYRSRGAVKAIRQALVTAGRLSSDLVCATIDAASLAENPAPAIDRLGVLAVDAERLGVRLALVWKGEDPTAVLGILQGIASPWLGLCQSPPVEEMPPPEVVSQLVARTLHVELRLAREDAAGDYRPWLEVLRAAGYRGAVALNASRAADVAAALRNGVAMVRRYA